MIFEYHQIYSHYLLSCVIDWNSSVGVGLRSPRVHPRATSVRFLGVVDREIPFSSTLDFHDRSVLMRTGTEVRRNQGTLQAQCGASWVWWPQPPCLLRFREHEQWASLQTWEGQTPLSILPLPPLCLQFPSSAWGWKWRLEKSVFGEVSGLPTICAGTFSFSFFAFL